MIAKHLELLMMAIPSLTRVGALINPDNPYYRSMTNSLQSTARKMGTAVSLANARSLEEVGHALASMKQDHVDAVIVLDDSLFMTHRLEVWRWLHGIDCRP